MARDEHTQTQTIEHTGLTGEGDARQHLSLVIAWSREEPGRIGERWLLPARGEVVIGRGGARADDPAPRLLPVQLRPGGLLPTGPLNSRQISRLQLWLTVRDGAVMLRNVGRCPLRYNDHPIEKVNRLEEGDVLELEGRMLLLCVRGPGHLPGAASHTFGEPDEHGIVGESAAAWELRRQLRFIGPRKAHVLILGESGVGKELAAQALHALSLRRDGPLIQRNAATLPEGLIDAELFGNIAGYPNPGMPARAGLVGAADGGSLFLDELAELPQEAQSHLLRVLDSGEFQSLGSARSRTADFRLLAATNRPPDALKHDILARFGLTLQIPDLNARRDDIPLLVRHILRQRLATDTGLAQRFSAPGGPRLSPRLLSALLRHTYTAHVRELSRILWQAMLESADGTLRLPASFAANPGADAGPPDWRIWAGQSPQDIPPEAIQACLDEHNGNQLQTTEALGLSSRYVLNRLVKRHQLVIRRSSS